MQWIKDKMGHTSGEGPNKQQNFMIGSDQWTGSSQQQQQQQQQSAPPPTSGSTTPMAPSGSFKNPSPGSSSGFAQSAGTQQQQQQQQQTFDEQMPNPYIQHGLALNPPSAPPPSDAGSNWSDNNSNSGVPPSGMYPNVYEDSHQAQQQQQQQQPWQNFTGATEQPDDEEVLTGEQVLVTIPGAVVHLVDDEESVHLASGEFSLVRITQEKVESIVIAKVGEELKWPLVQDGPTVKLDPTHYFFTLQVPREEAAAAAAAAADQSSSQHQTDTLNYGVTLPADDDMAARAQDLDYFLQRYSMFSAPTKIQGNASEVHHQAEERGTVPVNDGHFAGKVIPPETTVDVSGDGKGVDEESSAAFWTTIAPNVDDYNSKLARSIAKGAGHIIQDIFIFSDSTMAQLNSGHDYMVSKFKPKREQSNVSPSAINGVRSARKMTAKTDKVVGGILGGIVYATCAMSSAVVNSRPGKKFFKTAPGEVALVSLDAFGAMFDAVEHAGKNVLTRSSSVTQDFVNHRYGDSARQMTDESLRSVGHATSVVWSITKIHKAFNPKAVVKSAGKANRTTAQQGQPVQPVQPAMDANNPYVQQG